MVAKASFGEAGGTLGRSAECTLALNDPERHISRIQAEIVWNGREFSLIDRGVANPVQRNGEAVGNGRTVTLRDGDELQIGDYVLRVEDARVPAAANRQREQRDRLLYDDPFAQLLPAAAGATPMPRDHPMAPVIPDDFDLLSPKPLLGSVPQAGVGSDPRAGADQGLSPRPRRIDGQRAEVFDPGQRQADSLDLLFGLDRAPADPLALGAALGDPLAQPNTAVRQDALSALGMQAQAPMRAAADQAPEIHAQLRLPSASQEPGFRSWEEPEGISPTMIVGRQNPPVEGQRAVASIVEQAAVQHRRNFDPLPNTAITGFVESLNRQSAVPGSPPHSAAGSVAGASTAASFSAPNEVSAELLKAFLAGAGLRELPRQLHPPGAAARTLDPATMRQIGAVLRQYSQGTLALLAARNTTKRELRADVTVISTQDNNPLKFSPDATSALGHLLAAQTLRGFMEPESSVRDAFDDLLAHHIGVFAGMRAAMTAMLARFDPKQLEQRLASPSMLDSMLPANRKAKLWEQFQALYAQIVREAEDDFETLFGREFLKVYEAQIAQLHSTDSNPPRSAQ